jgi:hypothetical protein
MSKSCQGVPVSLLPSYLGMTGTLYAVGAAASGSDFGRGRTPCTQSHDAARQASVDGFGCLLPALYALMLVGSVRL